jgi:LPXTG-motif cell wall-anchored protein
MKFRMKEKEEKPIIAAKYFLWWFAWGFFSGILILIPIGGGGLTFGTQVFVILGLGVLSGSAGLFYYIKKKIKENP